MGQKNCIPGRVSGIPQANLPPGFELMSAVAVSSTNTYTSNTYNISNLDNVGLQIEFVGTMTGTLSVLASIDNVNFYSLTFTPVLSQPSGSNLGYLINLNQVPFPYIQVQYVN